MALLMWQPTERVAALKPMQKLLERTMGNYDPSPPPPCLPLPLLPVCQVHKLRGAWRPHVTWLEVEASVKSAVMRSFELACAHAAMALRVRAGLLGALLTEGQLAVCAERQRAASDREVSATKPQRKRGLLRCVIGAVHGDTSAVPARRPCVIALSLRLSDDAVAEETMQRMAKAAEVDAAIAADEHAVASTGVSIPSDAKTDVVSTTFLTATADKPSSGAVHDAVRQQACFDGLAGWSVDWTGMLCRVDEEMRAASGWGGYVRRTTSAAWGRAGLLRLDPASLVGHGVTQVWTPRTQWPVARLQDTHTHTHSLSADTHANTGRLHARICILMRVHTRICLHSHPPPELQTALL